MATVTTMSNSDAEYGYNRLKEVKQFDDSKVGVKGLVDLALTFIPKIFIHPKQTLSDIKSDKDHQNNNNNNNNFVPMIDLSGERSAVVEQVARACREVGFFQVVNHGVQQEVVDRAIIRVKGFHKQAMEVKAQLYGRDKPVSLFCNFHLFRSKGASWRFNWEVKNGDGWLNVEPVPGALVINVGNLMQIMSNNEYRSLEHKVQANSKMDPRISIGTFFSPGDRERRYEPFLELISTEKPAIYHDFLLTEYSKKLSTKESGKPMTDCFMIRER